MDNNQDELTQLRQENARLRSELAQTQLQCQHYERQVVQYQGLLHSLDLTQLVLPGRDDLAFLKDLEHELHQRVNRG
jgi:hypothetical protein